MKSKKGQPSGAPAASLLVVIGAFILIFILLLPSGERDELLNPEDDAVVDGGVSVPGAVLLKERPGTVTRLREREFEHNIPSFNLIVEREDAVLKEVDSVFVESSGVSARAVPVFVDGKAENGRLAFSVQDHNGNLVVGFNGEQIFKGEVSSLVDPLSLDNMERENVVEFSVEPVPSWQFWRKNFYDIRDVRITATVENDDNREALNTFFMTREEANPENIESAYIIYLVDCRVRDVGKLSVLVNGNLISSKVPDCGSLEKIFIDPSDFVEGRNELLFRVDRGSYLVDQVFVKTQLKRPIFPIYFFDLNSSQFERVQNDEINASIRFRFVDDDESKKAVVEVNSHKIFLDTREPDFSRNIDQFVVEGSNSVRIEPERTLQIVEFSVELDCRRKADCR